MDTRRLEEFPFLESLTEVERTQLAGWLQEREVSAGQTLVSQGAAGYVFYLIDEGTADVISDGRRVTELCSGDYFGEGAILGRGRRLASVVSTSSMRLLLLHGQEFRRMESAMPQVAARLRDVLAERLEQLQGV